MTNLTLSMLCTVMLITFLSTRMDATLVPLPGSDPVPVESLRVNNPAVLPMTGTWKFQLTQGADYGNGVFISTPMTSASSFEGINTPGSAVTDYRESHWIAKKGFPQWWQLDLGKTESVQGLKLQFEDKTVAYRYAVEGSTDGTAWNTLADFTAPPGITEGNGQVKISPADCRFIRVVFQGAQDSTQKPKPACIRNIEVTVLNNGVAELWQPQSDPNSKMADNAFTQTGFQDQAWPTIPVPANWEMEGFSMPTYNEPDTAVGLYRRWVDVPAGFTGKHVLWHFDGVFDGAEIFVNGMRMGYHESGFTAFDIDVTSALKPGQKNLFAVRVCKTTKTADLDTGDFWSLGGIYRENYLLAVPSLNVDDVKIITDLDDQYVNSNLKTIVSIKGEPGQKFAISGKLHTFDGASVNLPNIAQEGVINSDGSTEITLSELIPAPKLWSAEKPNLYYLVLNLTGEAGQQEYVQERFGFHKVEMKNGVVLWNGVRIKATGICRHEEWAALGHALNEEAWRRDIDLIKDANINAVRTSHYNHAQRFLELCEEKGLYIIDEVPGCWTDPGGFKEGWLLRTQETYNRDKNRPCILAWSIGNESGLGSADLAAYELMKKLDPNCPALISVRGPENNPELDIADYHYPSVDRIKEIAADPLRQTHPFVITEGPHVFCMNEALLYDYGCKDFWGVALNNQWKQLWNTDTALGAFIWEWQDQGLADKFPEKASIDPVTLALAGTDADTGGGDSVHVEPVALRGNNNKGIVDGYRNIKPEIWNVKMVYSPILIDTQTVQAKDGYYSIPLQNRYSFTNLSELNCNWQALMGGKTIASGQTHFNCAPLSSCMGSIPITLGTEVLALQFVHPDGRTIYSARLKTPDFKEPQPPAPLLASEKVTCEESSDQFTVTAAGTQIILDKKTGLLSSWKANGQDLILSGPLLNLGLNRGYHNEFSKPKDGALFPVLQSKEPAMLNNVAIISQTNEEGAVLLNISGDVMLVEFPAPVGTLAYTLTIHPNAKIDVSWKLNWTSTPHDVFELGMTLQLSNSFDNLNWYRDTLWTDYPAGHIGAPEGPVKSSDLSFRCTKRDDHWAELFGTGNISLVALRNGFPLQVRAQKDLDKTLFFLSEAVGPSREFSTVLVKDYQIHLQTGQTYSGGFTLSAAQH